MIGTLKRRTLAIAVFNLVSLMLAGTSPAADQLSAAGIFADSMVLQREMAVPVWGTAAPGTEVTVRFGGQTRRATADGAGKWRVKLAPLTASAKGAVLTITAGADSIALKDVLVGEVWLCGGQSNMAWTMDALTRKPKNPAVTPIVDHVSQEIKTTNDPLLRQFGVPKQLAPFGENTDLGRGSKWITAVAETVTGFSATGYFFGRALRKELGVPVGLIYSNWGGTRIEAWIPRSQYQKSEAMKAFYDQELAQLKQRDAAWDPDKANAAYQERLAQWQETVDTAKAKGKRPPRKPKPPQSPAGNNTIPATLYNGMIHPLAPYALRGATWYQGESNAKYRTEHYCENLVALVNGWRESWGQEKFYFYWCQLANFRAANDQPVDEDSWAEVQNHQREALRLTADTGMAVLNDIGEAGDIHPRNKIDAGNRLARWALHQAHGKDQVCSGPLYRNSKITGNKVLITFDHVGSGLMVGHKQLLDPVREVAEPLKRFQICGTDRQWKWAAAKIVGKDTVEVSHPEIAEPVEVRYAWSANPAGANLYNREGLPASLFTTAAGPSAPDR